MIQENFLRRFGVLFLLVAALSGGGCSDHGAMPSASRVEIDDAALFRMQAAAEGWTWFGLKADTLTGGSTTAHEPRVRVRYNAQAATRLTQEGRVIAGAVFPDSSLIVKELYTGSQLTTIAYMFKLRGAAYASEAGWVWAESDGAGGIKIPASRRGTGCVGCHAPGIDFTRMNDTHP
jgi:hypothetical protein